MLRICFLLTHSKMRASQKPRPAALYVKSVRRELSGEVWKALREYLSSSELPGFCFVGHSIMKIVTDDKLDARVGAIRKLMDSVTAPVHYVLEAAMRTPQKDD